MSGLPLTAAGSLRGEPLCAAWYYLTDDNSWTGSDSIEIVTDTREIIEFDDKYFNRAYKRVYYPHA